MKSDLFTAIFLFSTILGFSGWYFAETDNQILRQELAAQTYTKSIHSEDNEHDR